MIPPAAGLPAYTMPPTSGAPAGLRPHGPTSGAPAGGPAPTSGPVSGMPAGTSPPASVSGNPAGADFHQSAGSTRADAHPQTPTSGAPAGGGQRSGGQPPPAWNRPSSTYGVGAPAGNRQPFGGSAARVSSPPPHHDPHGQALPQQRGEGTVYGAQQSPIDMTMPVSMNAIENSGSLTGHILAQGWDRGVDTNRRSNVKVGIAMLVVLLFLVGVSLLFLFTAGDAFTDMVNDVFNKG
jgi:hypothetical protein